MTSARNLIDRPEIEEKALEVIRSVGKPVSCDFVAQNTGLAWHQARSLLFKLVAQGKLQMQDTTKSWIFFLREGPNDA